MATTEYSDIAYAARALAGCQRLLVLTGAGMSADSGVPTFRGKDGLWTQVDAESLASVQGFIADPERVWEWYRQRRFEVASCRPHAGQRALAMLQQYLPQSLSVQVATTNEDDLLERAGVADVLHVHGRLFDTVCSQHCGWSVSDDQDNSWSFCPCPQCGAPVRPGSTWFGEHLNAQVLKALDDFDPDGCVVVGSSSLVQPIAAIPPELAMLGRPVVEINIERTPLSTTASYFLGGSACSVLPLLIDQITSAVVRSQRVEERVVEP